MLEDFDDNPDLFEGVQSRVQATKGLEPMPDKDLDEMAKQCVRQRLQVNLGESKMGKSDVIMSKA